MGPRIWADIIAFRSQVEVGFRAVSQAMMKLAVMPLCIVLRHGSRARIIRLSVHPGSTGPGNFRQFDLDTNYKLKKSGFLINFVCISIKKELTNR